MLVDNRLHTLPVQDLGFKGLILPLSLLHPTFTYQQIFPTLPGFWQLLVLHLEETHCSVGKSSLTARQELAEFSSSGNQVPLGDKLEKAQEWDL